MQVSDVMTRNVVSVRPDQPVVEAIRLMLERGVSGLPVVGPNGQLVGIVTEGDFLRRAELGTERQPPGWLRLLLGSGREARDFVHSHGRRVAEVMTRAVQTTTEDAPLEEVVRLMERHGIKRAPVIRAGQIVGIVSRADLLKALEQLLTQAPSGNDETSDAAIERRLLEELARQGWAPRDLGVSAEGGSVTLRGIIFDERERQALRVLAENIPGVKAVRDELLWVEPHSGMAIVPPEDEAATKPS